MTPATIPDPTPPATPPDARLEEVAGQVHTIRPTTIGGTTWWACATCRPGVKTSGYLPVLHVGDDALAVVEVAALKERIRSTAERSTT